VGIFAYDARVEAQSAELEVINWVPPVTPLPATVRPVQPVHRTPPSNAPVDRTATRPERTDFVSTIDDPTHVPTTVGVAALTVPPITPGAVISHRNVDPPTNPNTTGGCITCSSTPTVVKIEETPPPPTPVKPQIQRVTSQVLISKIISLPQPPYPPIARQI